MRTTVTTQEELDAAVERAARVVAVAGRDECSGTLVVPSGFDDGGQHRFTEGTRIGDRASPLAAKTRARIAAGMAFPADYIWQGTKRARVRMAGNAVTPPAARDLIAAVVDSLEAAT